MATVVLSPTGASGWTNSNNVTASDNSYSSVNVSSQSSSAPLTVSFPGAGISASDIIDSVQVDVEGQASATSSIRLGGSTGGVVFPGGARETNNTAWTTSDAIYSVTNSSAPATSDYNSPWSLTIKVENGNFSSSRTALIDHVQVTITYHAGLVEKNVTDSDTVSVTEAAAVAATLSRSDAATIGVTETAQVDVVVSVSASDSATVTGTDAVVGINVGVTDADTVAVTEAASIYAGVAGSDSDSASGTDAASGTVTVTAADSDTASVGGETVHIALSASDSDTVSVTEAEAERRIIPITYDPRLALDVYDAAGNRLGSGPIVGILSAEYTGRLDEIGTWTIEVDATEPHAAELTRGRVVHLRREGEGLLFRGIVGRPDLTVGDADDRVLNASGMSLAEQLVWKNTLLGRTFSDVSMAAAVADLLTGTSWSAGTIDTGTLVSARFDGVSIWAALRQIAEIQGWHLREDNLNATVSLTAAGGSSGLVIRQVEHPDVDLGVIPLAGLRITGDDQELVNVIVPLGAGEGVNQLTLQYATASSPYTIQTDIGPDGEPYWYIKDAASIALYGERTRFLKEDQVAPLSNANSEIVAAANALYAIAAATLQRAATPVEHYEADVALLKHIVGGSPSFLLGQTVRLQYTGIVEDADGTRRAWRSVDADVYIMGYRRTFQSDGSDRWTLELATSASHATGVADAIADAVEDLWAIRTAMHPYNYNLPAILSRQSVDSTHDATVSVVYDDAVTYLRRATLRLTKYRVRSNVSTAAAGGAPTSNTTTTAANAGGGATSEAGAPHTHSISAGVTSNDIGEHYHQIGQAQPTSGWVDPAYLQQMIFASSAGGGLDYGIYGGRNGTEGSTRTLWTSGFTFHQHNISATATASESSHRHDLPSHTHSINPHSHTIAPHTHSLTYGIFEGPTASAPQFTIAINGVDVTAALGGPWNGDIDVDVTAWLVDVNGHVLRQSNKIVIGSAQLCDIEVIVMSFVTSHSVVPV